MRYKKIITATAVSLAAAIGVYAGEKNIKHPEEILINNASNHGKIICDNKFESAIKKSLLAVHRAKNELGLPGIVVGVSVNGKTVWAQGFGLANVETSTPCDAQTKMRIASISKPITIALLAKLMEAGVVDIDKPIQEYVKHFPEKSFSGEKVTITARLLASHKAGIRHYKENKHRKDSECPEFYLKDRFDSVEKSVDLFKNDDLVFKPGEGYEYTTHGYTLLSAVIEGAMKSPFPKEFQIFLNSLGLTETHLDEISTLVYGRASYYVRKKNGKLMNASLTDNSYKWAGGGLISNVENLLKFADTMLYSYQQRNGDRDGFLKSDTVKLLWTIVPGTKQSSSADAGYGLGWAVYPYKQSWYGSNELQRFHVGHSGGAVGASSILAIYPSNTTDTIPSGVSVAILTNLEDVGLKKLSKEIAEYFIQNTHNTG